MNEIIDDLISKVKLHPLVSLLIVAGGIYLIYVLSNRQKATPVASTGGTPAQPSEIIKQQFNSFPVVQTVTTPATPVTTTPPPTGTPPVVLPGPIKPKPLPQPQQFITVKPWPDKLSTLWGISQHVGKSLATVEALNPGIKNPNLIYAGQQVRIA